MCVCFPNLFLGAPEILNPLSSFFEDMCVCCDFEFRILNLALTEFTTAVHAIGRSVPESTPIKFWRSKGQKISNEFRLVRFINDYFSAFQGLASSISVEEVSYI